MPSSRRYAARLRRPAPAQEDRRRLPGQRSHASAEAASPAGRIMRLQQTIGNHAVQRLIVQRQPKGGTKQKALPPVVAKIVLDSGELDGGSEVEGHAGEVEFDTLNVGQLNKGGGADFIDLNWSRLMDRASVLLQHAQSNGDHIASARFDFIKADESGAVTTYLSVEYKDGEVTEFHYAGDDSSGRPIAAGSFIFKRA